MSACLYPDLSHRTGYSKGCRCTGCRAANTDAAKASRAKRFARSKSSPANVPHGLGGYLNWGCRCPTCTDAHQDFLSDARTRRRSQLASVPHGTESGYTSWGCRCRSCRTAAARRVAPRNKRRNDRSRDLADHHGAQWTGPQLEIALRPDLTAAAAAKILGRTIYAVTAQRHLSRIDPRKQSLVGLHTSTTSQEN